MRIIVLTGLIIAMATGAASAQATAWKTLDGRPPLVVGHRGAPGYLPDHTIEGYRLAIAQGADFVEPDLVATRDGVLVARHEPYIGDTTDVADRPEFAARRVTRKLDGVDVTDWWVGDFTLAEIRTLRARQPMKERDASHDGKYLIPTLEEVIALVKAESARLGRTIGIYPETKHPTFHAAIGLKLEDRLLAVLAEAGWRDASAPVLIQSFEVANLKYLRSRTTIRLMQLVGGDGLDKDGNIRLRPATGRPYDFVVAGDPRSYKDLVTKAGLAEIRTYADGVAPWKPYLIPTRQVDANGDGKPDDLNGDGIIDERDRVLMAPTSLVADAHAAGLIVHTWTFRSEPRRLASDFKGDPEAEYRAFFALGLDGLFSDFPDQAVKARDGK